MDIIVPIDSRAYFNGSRALLIHNWRCAGTSLHSLFKANLHNGYIKIGDPLNKLGNLWLNPKLAKASTTLNYIRRHSREGSIVAGHVFMGLQAFIPGNWLCWMNAREPVARIRSGILRFYSRDTSNKKALTYDLIKPSNGVINSDSILSILNTSLKHECNGLSRRLAALSLASSIKIEEKSNLEQVEFLSSTYDENALYAAAREQLDNIDHLFLAEHLTTSFISLEKRYNLPPLVNPFTLLHHNPAIVSGYSAEQASCLDSNIELIRQSQLSDLKLWHDVKKRFAAQVNSSHITKREIQIRELIHSRPLFDEQWLKVNDPEEVLDKMAEAIISRAQNRQTIALLITKTITAWPALSIPARDKLRALVQRKTINPKATGSTADEVI